MDLSFRLRPVDSKDEASPYVVVVLYHDARLLPRVEAHLVKYGKVKQRHYLASEDSHGVNRDRLAVYILEDTSNTRALKSGLRNMEKSWDLTVIIRKT